MGSMSGSWRIRATRSRLSIGPDQGIGSLQSIIDVTVLPQPNAGELTTMANSITCRGASVLLSMVLGSCNTLMANVVPANRCVTGYATFLFLIGSKLLPRDVSAGGHAGDAGYGASFHH